MTPTIGRIVHYTNLGDADHKFPPEIHPAIITGFDADGDACLHIWYKQGSFDMTAPFTEAPAGSDQARGKWSWPTKEQA